MSLVTHQLKRQAKLVTVGGAAFRREPDDKGLAVRGAVYLLVEHGEGPGGKCNMPEYESRKQVHVVRGH
eukprot:2358820-Pyramimonas_sp.AAC.1